MKLSHAAIRALLVSVVSALLRAAPQPTDCYDSQERFQQCMQGIDVDAEFAFVTGVAYDQGIAGFPQDYSAAASWYRLAALQGHSQAQANLALLYAAGEGVPQDYTEAYRWSRKAAEAGNATAQAIVGSAYLYGRSVRQDYKAAAEWLRRSAEQGDELGEIGMGTAYEYGWGVPQDYVQAHMWFNLASAQARAETKARKGRDEVEARMTPAQIAEAQRLAREFRPKVP